MLSLKGIFIGVSDIRMSKAFKMSRTDSDTFDRWSQNEFVFSFNYSWLILIKAPMIRECKTILEQ